MPTFSASGYYGSRYPLKHMFTGLVETTGKLFSREPRGPGYRMQVATRLAPLEVGESISVNGACLTVVGSDAGSFSVDVSIETAERTTLGRVPIGSELNLERSLRMGDRLGGHFVSGHIDGTARLADLEVAGEAWRAVFEVAPEHRPFIAPKGSVCLDGVSLTVNRILDGGGIEVMLIPHTLAVTNLKQLEVGRELNLEVDLIARHVVHYLSLRNDQGA